MQGVAADDEESEQARGAIHSFSKHHLRNFSLITSCRILLVDIMQVSDCAAILRKYLCIVTEQYRNNAR